MFGLLDLPHLFGALVGALITSACLIGSIFIGVFILFFMKVLHISAEE
jgi:hypothetical protein